MNHLYMHELIKFFYPSLVKAAFLSALWFSRCSRSAVQSQSSGVTTLGGLGLAFLSALWFSRGSRSAVQNQSSGVTTLGGWGLSGYFWPVEEIISFLVPGHR